MSRIGKKVIDIPDNVEFKVDGNLVSVKGPKGALSRVIHENMSLDIKKLENSKSLKVSVSRPDDSKANRSLHGLTRTLVANMVEGVTKGFTKELEVNGVGYRVQKQGKNLNMNLGYSHPVVVPDTDDVKTEASGSKITVIGIDKQKVGQFAAILREKRPPEPYKGKGIKYIDEVIRRKEGKAAKGSKK
ncbi:MAG: 50S ribosomal protein L6 [Oscillospiraceae bacterium]|nr:50S ribosomal protein L6 [Oscillospiraceae bacterium]